MHDKATKRKAEPGIEVCHSRSCPATGWEVCKCNPTYKPSVYDKRAKRRDGKRGKKIYAEPDTRFPTLAAAKSWRIDALHALRRGTLRAPTPETIRDASDKLIEGMKNDSIRKLNGKPYKPSAIRSYEAALTNRINPEFGDWRKSQIQRNDLQDYADRLVAEGLDASTIRNVFMPVRLIYRRAVNRGEVAVNPTTGLELPAVEGRRDRVATPEEATRLIAALPADDRALWATAFYAGPRMGELRALQVEDVDLAAGVIRIRQSWDKRDGFVDPKSEKGKRTIPVVALLRDYLDEHKLRLGRDRGFLFGETADRPFNYDKMFRRAQAAWEKAKLTRITLHEARHTCVTLFFEAGLSLERIGDYVGHNSAYMTERYRHLLEGHEAEAAALVDAYLSRSDTQARIAQVADA